MLLNHKSFSLIELIFAIIIIGIISTIAIPKLLNTTQKTTILKAKNDLNIILNGLKNYKNNLILQNSTLDLDNLEEDEIYLFSKIIKKPFISNPNKTASWSKVSNKQYKYWIDNSIFILFNYDKTTFSFICDKSEDLCKKVLE
ncbi:MAG: prepilin-type N-terminal cleavage/methylation domain-containing protein [Arcobacteraceae bacterium]|nr:prepilin-type N-terminal cleavage/methylation domain-containing protein [Arcobacteraceae bacterium]